MANDKINGLQIDVEVICDNGGGITVQTPTFAHHYRSADQAAEDVKAILSGDDCSGWDGNEPEARVEPTLEDISNGGYRVIDPAPLPIKNYTSTMRVMQLSPGVSTVIWRSTYENGSNGEVPDDEVIALLNGAYKMGLDSLKIDLE